MVFRSMFNRRRRSKKQKKADHQENFTLNVSKHIQTNIDNLSNMLEDPEDLKMRELKLSDANIKCAVAYIEGIVNELTIQINILGNIEQADRLSNESEQLFKDIYDRQIAINDVEKLTTLDDVSLALLSGKTILYVDGVDIALAMDTIGGEFRAIEEPLSETLIRGPRTGFVEILQINMALIRRYARDPNLRFKTHQAGRRSKINIVVTYVDGIVNPKLVKEINRRLQTIDIDIIQESGFIEEWIEDSYLSPFPQMRNTERPDKVVSEIMKGKVAILIDGTPFVLIAPVSFSDVLQSTEDYYERWTIGTLLRMLRYLGALISILLPALYIALISMQPGMIPSDLVFSIAGTREGVPFPPVIEALLMVITMEMLQEAGARLPQTIGQTIGIVGGLVIGEAAVRAGIVSPIMVIVIALTAIANFAVPSFSVAITFRIIRFGFMFAAAVFGLFGIVLTFITICIHLVNLKSFGLPYTTPIAPFFKSDWGDIIIIRTPLPAVTRRSKHLLPEDEIGVDRKGEEQ